MFLAAPGYDLCRSAGLGVLGGVLALIALKLV
jgi:hypothetical protein